MLESIYYIVKQELARYLEYSKVGTLKSLSSGLSSKQIDEERELKERESNVFQNISLQNYLYFF